MDPNDFNRQASISGLHNSSEELKNMHPFAVCDSAGNILLANSAYHKYILNEKAACIAELNSDPPLYDIIQNFAEKDVENIIFDISLPEPLSPEADAFQVYAEKIRYEDKARIVLLFSSGLTIKAAESKINDFYQALDLSGIPLIFADSQGMIKYSTKSFETILESKFDDIYGLSLVDALKRKIDDAEKASLLQSMLEQKTWNGIVVSEAASRAKTYWEIKIHSLVRNSGDDIKYALTAHDITDFIIKNKIVKESEKRLRAIINNISDLLIIVRKENDALLYEASNNNFSSVFEFERETVYRKPIDDILHYSFVDVIKRSIEAASGENEERQNFVFVNYADKKEYSVKTAPIKDPYDEAPLYIISLKDITEEKLLERKLKHAYEKELAINKLKSSFLENMSHEVRTPLNAVVGYSDLLEEDIKDKDYSSALEMIGNLKDGVKRLLNFVEDIIEVSLIESAEILLDIKVVSVNPIIENLCLKMRSFAHDKNISFKWDLEQTNACVRLDENKFMKIMMDLIENAIKYTPAGSVSIKTFIEDGLYKIEVQDTGIGIKEENLMKILEPFAQEDMGAKRNYEGAGLGLTIAYKLTRLMGGVFTIESKKNEGTTVSLAYPALKSMNKPA
jgi:PAS domain S-box-containing protein